jgi:undecaprenyl-diphosphatase
MALASVGATRMIDSKHAKYRQRHDSLLQYLSGNIVLDTLAIAVTRCGALLIVAAVAIGWWWNKTEKLQERHMVIVCGASVALGLAINQLVLLLAHRARPYDVGFTHLLIAPSADPSFPSDHATLGFAVAFAMLARRVRRGWKFLLAAIMLAASRLYVGTHYLSDVLGGAFTGAMAAVMCVGALKQDSKVVRLASRIL